MKTVATGSVRALIVKARLKLRMRQGGSGARSLHLRGSRPCSYPAEGSQSKRGVEFSDRRLAAFPLVRSAINGSADVRWLAAIPLAERQRQMVLCPMLASLRA